MQNKFKGNYIKRVSFYAGIVSFIVYFVVNLIMWIVDFNKEADNLLFQAKAELSLFISFKKFLKQLIHIN